LGDVQTLFTQLDPATHSPPSRQRLRHESPPHTYGEHDVGAEAGRQVPLPSQVRAVVNVLPEQD
jgi:hypothetical protein